LEVIILQTLSAVTILALILNHFPSIAQVIAVELVKFLLALIEGYPLFILVRLKLSEQ
jgi:hypothetical protein